MLGEARGSFQQQAFDDFRIEQQAEARLDVWNPPCLCLGPQPLHGYMEPPGHGAEGKEPSLPVFHARSMGGDSLVVCGV